MSVAHYIVLERDIEGLNVAMDGKALSRNIEALDETAERLGVRPLSDFFRLSADDAADVLGDVEGMDLPGLEQFSAQDGLTTIRALLAQPEAQPALHDLKDCERILAVAAQHGVGWHFQIDV